jgi:hypothetical protein
MAVDFFQTPGVCSITCVQGDELSVGLNFAQSIVGYSLTALVYEEALASNLAALGSSGTYTVGTTKATFNVGVTSAAAGTLAISLTETQTAAFSPGGRYRWYFRWQNTAGYTQTILSGPFTVVVP